MNMVVTDDERRRVAARLRGLAGGYVTIGEMEDALGICMSSPIVDLERDARDLHRLANLIEPPTQCPYYHSDRHHCSAYDDVVDRDTLLALADEMQRDLDECASDHEIAGKLQYRIDCIREALKVSVEVK